MIPMSSPIIQETYESEIGWLGLISGCNGKPGVITVVTDNANIRQFAEMNAPWFVINFVIND